MIGPKVLSGELDLDVMSTPFQALDHEVGKRAERSRAEKAAKNRNCFLIITKDRNTLHL